MRRLLAIAAVLAVPTSASAATPDKGTVSAASPKVAWEGSLQNPYLFHNVFNYEAPGTVPCEAPACDTFTLDVADGGTDLLLEVASEQTEDMSLRVQDPAGTWTYYPGWGDGSKPTKVRIKKAPKGTYVINVVARVFGTTQPTAVTDTADYKGTAALAVAPVAAPAPAPVAAAAPPAPASQPAPAPAAKKKPSARAACQKKAKKIKNKRKRTAALKRCAKKR